MFTLTALMKRLQHPLSWLYILLFYINLFAGIWLHNWLIISASLAGVLAVVLFQPHRESVPIWAQQLTTHLTDTWLALTIAQKTGIMATAIAVTALFIAALWYHFVVGVVLTLFAIIILKAYFMRPALKRLCDNYTKSKQRPPHNPKND